MKRVPSVKSPDISKVKAKLFIEGKGGHPWDEGDERVIKAFNLRLPERCT